jgi:hypothetical protein
MGDTKRGNGRNIQSDKQRPSQELNQSLGEETPPAGRLHSLLTRLQGEGIAPRCAPGKQSKPE